MAVITNEMQDALNGQINAELYSSYMYLSMSAWLESQNLAGLAGWMRVQAKEEQEHAMKIFDYVLERGGRVTLEAVEKPAESWASAAAVFENAYNHEMKVTGLIEKLAEKAESLGDRATGSFLKWFIDEQVEEEATASLIVEQLKMAGQSAGTLLMLDHQLGKRGKQ